MRLCVAALTVVTWPPQPRARVAAAYTRAGRARFGASISWEVTPAVLRRNSNVLLEITETVLLALLIFFGTRMVVQNFRVDGGSMVPGLENGEFLLVNKLAYVAAKPDRGDVVVFRSPANPEEDLVKRIVGLPNETIEVHDGGVYVNGRRLDEDEYFAGVTAPGSDRSLVVPEQGYYVLGDNRGQSIDSRRFRVVPEAAIVGKVWLVYWPVDKIGLLHGASPGFEPAPERISLLPAA